MPNYPPRCLNKVGDTQDMLVRLLRYRPKNLVEFRVVFTLTMGCMRPDPDLQPQL